MSQRLEQSDVTCTVAPWYPGWLQRIAWVPRAVAKVLKLMVKVLHSCMHWTAVLLPAKMLSRWNALPTNSSSWWRLAARFPTVQSCFKLINLHQASWGKNWTISALQTFPTLLPFIPYQPPRELTVSNYQAGRQPELPSLPGTTVPLHFKAIHAINDLSNLLSLSLLWAFVPEMPAGSIHIPEASRLFVLLGLKTRSETHNFELSFLCSWFL